MNGQPLPLSNLLFALAGPIVWAAHFFTLYLSEAFACTDGVDAAAVGWIGTGATIVALAALAVWGARFPTGAGGSREGRASPHSLFAFAPPLTVLSMLAILWSAMPLFLLQACTGESG
jgi:hypothetical protein